MLAQSADTPDDERNILIGAPNRPPDDNAKNKRWRYGLPSALGQKADIAAPAINVYFSPESGNSLTIRHLTITHAGAIFRAGWGPVAACCRSGLE